MLDLAREGENVLHLQLGPPARNHQRRPHVRGAGLGCPRDCERPLILHRVTIAWPFNLRWRFWTCTQSSPRTCTRSSARTSSRSGKGNYGQDMCLFLTSTTLMYAMASMNMQPFIGLETSGTEVIDTEFKITVQILPLHSLAAQHHLVRYHVRALDVDVLHEVAHGHVRGHSLVDGRADVLDCVQVPMCVQAGSCTWTATWRSTATYARSTARAGTRARPGSSPCTSRPTSWP